jgi:hypothetical protein
MDGDFVKFLAINGDLVKGGNYVNIYSFGGDLVNYLTNKTVIIRDDEDATVFFIHNRWKKCCCGLHFWLILDSNLDRHLDTTTSNQPTCSPDGQGFSSFPLPKGLTDKQKEMIIF